MAVVITSIARPNIILKDLAKECANREYHFIVIGDQNSPADFHIDGCDFYSLEKQKQTGFKLGLSCPTKHYARKNIGYLIAIRNGASIIIETDDDNFPLDEFWKPRILKHKVPALENSDWVNIYKYFTDENIWPRGFPLEQLQKNVPYFDSLSIKKLDCPIQQGLADDNPDVDAVYRLTQRLPLTFRKDRRLALGNGSKCPFNSQNTTWFPDAYPLLYLPAYCSFRMTDIWRSFIAQRIAFLNGWSILFHEPTMTQQRNVHNLLRDFEQEIPGYLYNTKIVDAINDLDLKPGIENISDNLRFCYQKLVGLEIIGDSELILLDDWLEDINNLC
ncbi:MAG: STELLO glycosyltransferase family protein [Planctomycetota bacterium]